MAVEEAGRNVRNKRPTWLADFDSLAMRVEVVDSAEFPLPVDLVEKDRPILCAAVRAGCDLLVTGDRRHFGHLYDITGVLGVRVVDRSPASRNFSWRPSHSPSAAISRAKSSCDSDPPVALSWPWANSPVASGSASFRNCRKSKLAGPPRAAKLTMPGR